VSKKGGSKFIAPHEERHAAGTWISNRETDHSKSEMEVQVKVFTGD